MTGTQPSHFLMFVLQKQSIDVRKGSEDDTQTDLYDLPKYEHMAMAAAMDYDETTIRNQESINDIFADLTSVYASLNPSKESLHYSQTIVGHASTL